MIHTAAVSDIGTCQANPEESYLANVTIPLWLAQSCTGKKLICFSSDQVYGGSPEAGPYTEEMAAPENLYARQMLAMGRALMSRPKLLLLDEPSMGLAPLLVKEIFNIIKEINESGTTVLLVEQNANMALSIADKAYVLETGRITLSGTAKELASSEAVRKAYLGG